ncbi:hypothetical protein CATRI_12970 [Corynebacterium atrinae]|uniref:hypothetical protein n=1 Tax=Corynebacterium atrinae TaxID=1336740 RepID=UPI0025B62038|nr:hypothetical protein [Corynebacterium atrinae]WJY64639.1 hypothetical protein CATRI_12970 [Corynebacterium atrinae]
MTPIDVLAHDGNWLTFALHDRLMSIWNQDPEAVRRFHHLALGLDGDFTGCGRAYLDPATNQLRVYAPGCAPGEASVVELDFSWRQPATSPQRRR